MCAGSYLILLILNVTGSSYCPYFLAYALIYLNSNQISLSFPQGLIAQLEKRMLLSFRCDYYDYDKRGIHNE